MGVEGSDAVIFAQFDRLLQTGWLRRLLDAGITLLPCSTLLFLYAGHHIGLYYGVNEVLRHLSGGHGLVKDIH